jgi:hypothetical protein
MNIFIKLVAASSLCAALVGCGTPRYLVGDTFTGSRTSKTILMPTANATDKKEVLYNYVVRLCDVDAEGVESNCNDTVVLENVIANSIY